MPQSNPEMEAKSNRLEDFVQVTVEKTISRVQEWQKEDNWRRYVIQKTCESTPSIWKEIDMLEGGRAHRGMSMRVATPDSSLFGASEWEGLWDKGVQMASSRNGNAQNFWRTIVFLRVDMSDFRHSNCSHYYLNNSNKWFGSSLYWHNTGFYSVSQVAERSEWPMLHQPAWWSQQGSQMLTNRKLCIMCMKCWDLYTKIPHRQKSYKKLCVSSLGWMSCCL